MLISKGCLVGWHFLYIPEGRDAGVNLMPTAEQREMLRLRGAQRIRNEKPLFVVDFWNDAPYVGGCIAGGFRYFHINAQGDVEPCIFVHLATDNIKQKSLSEAINSPFFKGIRSQQPYGENFAASLHDYRPPVCIAESILRFSSASYRWSGLRICRQSKR
jgi:MoaA/NifB/PqqE/SkfB family radical SAM enzyme